MKTLLRSYLPTYLQMKQKNFRGSGFKFILTPFMQIVFKSIAIHIKHLEMHFLVIVCHTVLIISVSFLFISKVQFQYHLFN